MSVQPGSGCGRINKEDVVDDCVLMQAKSTRKETITVRFEDLWKLRQHAISSGRSSAFAIGFVLEGSLNHGFFDHRIWIAMPLEEWSKSRRR
jgi:hypothetical protein